ncbi:hypothetical protein, partial [Rhizobium sp. PP-CC-3G-465]|uniref:hypothetical protein n=1 Tax=Rhizobium sp. PP-CC-3G-465 TaxID=2135648 RepID=UPI00104BC083
QRPPPTFLFLIFNCQKTDKPYRSVTSLNDQSLKPQSPQNLSRKSLKLFCLRPPTRYKVKKLQSEFVGRQQRRRPRWCAVYRSETDGSSTAPVRKTS